MDRQLTEDNFDDVARQAGDALRREAPADGMIRIRRTRRRQQQVRTATGVTAVAAIIAIGAFVATRNDDTPALVIQPEQTVPGTTQPVPTTPPSQSTSAPQQPAATSVPPTPAPTSPTPTSPPGTAPEPQALSDEARAWIDARIADGHTLDLSEVDGASFRVLTTMSGPTFRSAFLLADGRIVEPPVAFPVVTRLGDRPAAVQVGYLGTDTTTTEVWVFDTSTEQWTSTGDVGLPPIDGSGWGSWTVRAVDDRLIVANNQYVDRGDGAQVLSPDQAGVVIASDLEVAPIAPAPDGVALYFSSASGGKALQMYGPAIEGGTELDLSTEQPWQYDPVANEWSEIPLPGWSTCSDDPSTCGWVNVADIGSIELEVATDRGLVTLVPDGTVGLYDATTSTWTRLDDPPIELVMPTTALVDDQLVVAPWRSGVNDFSTVAVLDLDAGTWIIERVEIPADVEARFGTEWTDVSWDLRVAGSRVMMAPGQSFQASTIDPIVVYDTNARGWYAPDERDIAAWNAASLGVG